ncbi:unnamed protein product [Musa textilis]
MLKILWSNTKLLRSIAFATKKCTIISESKVVYQQDRSHLDLLMHRSRSRLRLRYYNLPVDFVGFHFSPTQLNLTSKHQPKFATSIVCLSLSVLIYLGYVLKVFLAMLDKQKPQLRYRASRKLDKFQQFVPFNNSCI